MNLKQASLSIKRVSKFIEIIRNKNSQSVKINLAKEN